MNIKELKPKIALNKNFLRLTPDRAQINHFKAHFCSLLQKMNEKESEEFHKNLISDFLKNSFFGNKHYINTKGRNDLVIHLGSQTNSSVGVILEVKKTGNKTEMLSRDNLNKKAFHELLLYYLRERILLKNLEIKHLIATNVEEWYIFDAKIFETIFVQNKTFLAQFLDFENGRLSDNKTDFFYKNIAETYIASSPETIEFTYLNVQDFRRILRSPESEEDSLLIPLFKILSPEHLLKLPFSNDSNSLDKGFYDELLHILGLTEMKEGGIKLIKRKQENERHEGSVLEETIAQLDSLDKLSRLPKASQYGKTKQERLFNVAIELSITWINRILFLKLLEAQLISYHKGDKNFAFLTFNKIKGYSSLNNLFFQILAREHEARHEGAKKAFEHVPYLNSSLFEPTELEHNALLISNLDENKNIPIFSQTILKDLKGKKRTGDLNTLQYLFEFLDAYDFGAENHGEIKNERKTLINAPVLGLIFEKINGYKDGSFFTPGFITMFMCRETIRKAIVQKFSENYPELNLKGIDEIYEIIPQKISRKEANRIVDSVKICDPAVGSGHFLVSALNELIAIKNDLKILEDKDGKSIHRYEIRVENDELSVFDEDGELFKYNPNNKESQRVQETLFREKQKMIENCLFGVDINQNSVKICRLRLWIELLKNAFYKSKNELETLPNIDINIKCGNSLVSRFSLDSDLRQVLKKSNRTIESYQKAVATYRNAENKEQKRETERLIADIKSDFRTEISKNEPKLVKKRKLEGDLYNLLHQSSVFGETENDKKEKAKQVEKISAEIQKLEAEIEEMKENLVFDRAFEWRFEFPEVLNENGDFMGFDVVMGNPPYIDYREIDKLQIDFMQNFKTFEASQRPNLYQFFIEKGYTLLKQRGHFCFINPNQFLSIDAGFGLRKFIIENTIIEFIADVSNIKVFDNAAAYTVVWAYRKEKNGNYPVKISKSYTEEEIGKNPIIVRKNDIIANGKYLIIANINQVLIQKIEKDKEKLGNLCQMIWGTSQSGYGKKKIKNYDYLLLSKDLQTLYKPIIQTRDIKKYYIEWKEEFIPVEIFSTKAIEKFNLNEKIVIARMTLQLQAAVDDKQNFVGKSTILYDLDKTLNIHFLLALLNSRLINGWYKNYFENTHLSGGYIRFDIPYLKKIPVFIPDKDAQEIISEKVKKLILLKKNIPHADTSAHEAELDRLIYALYDLTEEEIKIVEKL